MRAAGAMKMKRHFDVKIGTDGYLLAVSRAIGHLGSAMVSHEPEIFDVAPGWASLVLATDGVWDHVTKGDAAALVAQAPGTQQAADALLAAAVRNGSTKRTRDNASAVVVRPFAAAAAGDRDAARPAGGCCTVM